MEYAITWGGDPEEALVTTAGPATADGLRAMVAEMRSAGRLSVGSRVLFDHTRLDWSTLSAEELHDFATELGTADLRPSGEPAAGRVAVVVSSAVGFGLQRMLEGVLDRYVDAEIGVFYTVDEARAWLGADR